MTNYKLNIVFYMKTYAQFKLDEPYEFNLNKLNFKLSKIHDINDSYSIIIKPIKNISHAKKILNEIKIAFSLFVLKYPWVAIEIDEKIKSANILKEKGYLNDLPISGDYEKTKTTLIPIIPHMWETTSPVIPFINNLEIEKLKDNIEKAFSINCGKISNDEKLSLCLEMYSRLSQFSQKTQFLELITILEILKPQYDVSNESKNNVKLIKDNMKKLRNTFEKESEEYKEFDRYFHDAHFWESKSINKSLQKFANEHQSNFNDIENIDKFIKKAYSIRSNIVHKGIIDEEFDKYYDFLKDFVGKLLKIMIYELEN